jgi:hypothetical protein
MVTWQQIPRANCIAVLWLMTFRFGVYFVLCIVKSYVSVSTVSVLEGRLGRIFAGSSQRNFFVVFSVCGRSYTQTLTKGPCSVV